jgi:hypothetical protein
MQDMMLMTVGAIELKLDWWVVVLSGVTVADDLDGILGGAEGADGVGFFCGGSVGECGVECVGDFG